MPGSSKWSLPLRPSNQNAAYTSPSPHMCYVPCLSHSSQFHHLNNNGWGLQITKVLIVVFSTPITSTLLGPNILHSTLLSNTLSLRSSLSVSDQVSHPYKTQTKL
jgi:hypothetical protein